jgi:RimJ/RimL family protein N-acetyltransferase
VKEPEVPPWPLSDGVVTLRPPRPGEEQVLIAGRDAEWARWLGPGSDEPRPTAVVVVERQIVGWVDYDAEHDWLGPHEVNVGYNVFAPHRRKGYATRAVGLLLGYLRDHTDVERAHLVIHADNAASLRVARAIGAPMVGRHVGTTGPTASLRHTVELGEFGPGRGHDRIEEHEVDRPE